MPPAELEGILLKHEAVKEAAVVGKPDERAGELPVAFIVKQCGKDVKAEELVQFVAGGYFKFKLKEHFYKNEYS